MDKVDENVGENLLSEFEERLHHYCDKLFFEIGGAPGEDQEIIITAEGDTDYFDRVEQLINDAPSIDGWKFIAFKQPMPGHFKSAWDDLELNTEDMWFLPLSNSKNADLGISVVFKNYEFIKDNEILDTLVYKMLDTIIGEKSFAFDIAYVETGQQPDDPEEMGMFPILELPGYIKWHKFNAEQKIR